MKIIPYFIGAALLATNMYANDGDSIQVIEGGEGYKFVTISLKDLSRIHCNSQVSNIFYSKEKEIEIKTAGNDAYIKVLPKRTTGGGEPDRIEYGSHPRELYVECQGETFSLVLVPKDLPAQTIVLKTAFSDVKKALEYEKSNPYDTMILDLIKKGFMEITPDGYEGKQINKEIANFEELSLNLTKKYVGGKFSVEEYLIDAKKPVSLYEGMFIPYLKNPLAITIVKSILEPKESTRMIVVTMNGVEEK